MKMLISGILMESAETFPVINPANEEIIASAPQCSRGMLDDAFSAAETAFESWSRDIHVRRDVLTACAAAMRDNADELARLVTQEQGKPLAKAQREIGGAARWFEYTAELDLPVEPITVPGQRRAEIHRRPLGVVAAIIPWNYPIMTAAWKIAPALLAGNTVVLKPSPYTPLATLRLGEILRPHIPEGVLNIVSGGDDLGVWMTAHKTPRKIAFTGSTDAGKSVAAAAANDLKRVTLELGGNDPAIVLADADPKTVANGIFTAAFENSGQVCVAIKRVYLPDNLYQPVLDEMTALANNVKLGDGLNEDVDMGPVNNRAQFERVLELIEDSRQRGGAVIAGGKRKGDTGYFIEPTIITDLADDARLVAEEQFGPALPILRYSDIDDALARANAGHFGLAGSVWGADGDSAAEVAGKLNCGTAWVNQHLAITPQAPIAGRKWSGVGIENGPLGLLQYTDLQIVEVPETQAATA
ncbi:aldehyde dehydrogenase family protein [Hyphococcus sp.]|uniref:aldehyde dehydrogenase family protein n=1 Tax=Hyphococcus sp. TaxID=2038636 RepID=UPI003CCB9D67